MKRYKIDHKTSYLFPCEVQLYPHILRLRPREGHELRIEKSSLHISPTATLRWHRDVEENSVATASFTQNTNILNINSEVIIQQYNQSPYDFLVADYAVDYPFIYKDEDKVLLAPYLNSQSSIASPQVTEWVRSLWRPKEKIQTVALLIELNNRINQTLSYRIREEEGVQSAEKTLSYLSGSCRDAANLFMIVARYLGIASRFISGYHYISPGINQVLQPGSTHAWAEVFIPGAGWRGFDPTTGIVAGPEHIAVAVARLPESVPPVSGAYLGSPGTSMHVSVEVTECN